MGLWAGDPAVILVSQPSNCCERVVSKLRIGDVTLWAIRGVIVLRT